MAEGEGIIALQSSEGEVFKVTLETARVSRTLSIMLSDLGHNPDDLVPLPNVTTDILKRVIAWSEHSVQEGLDKHTNPSNFSPTTNPLASSAPSSSDPVPFQPRPQPHVPSRSLSRRALPPSTRTLSPWEKDFLSHNKSRIYELLLAANYLDIKSLLDVLCRTVADVIKGRNPQEIRRAFHVSDSTPHETPPTSPLAAASQSPNYQAKSSSATLNDLI